MERKKKLNEDLTPKRSTRSDVYDLFDPISMTYPMGSNYCIFCKSFTYTGVDGDVAKSVECNGDCGEETMLDEEDERKPLQF